MTSTTSEIGEQPPTLPRGFNPEAAFRILEKKMDRVRTQNKMAAIRLMFDKLDELQRDGMPLVDIVEGLAEAGLVISVATLKSAMLRIRRERGISLRKKKARSAVAKPAPAPGKHQDETPEPPGQFGQSLVRPASKTLTSNPAPNPMRSKKQIVADVENKYAQYLPRQF